MPDSHGSPARFHRAGGRNRFTAREATVVAVTRPAPPIVRVSLTGPDFADFTSGGPADHVRVFFPDAVTGELIAPRAAGPGEDGIVRPDAAMIARDFTPLPTEGGLDLDFFVHPDPGPASAWAEKARPGDSLVIVGPRGSRAAPQDIDGLLLIVDETSFPSATRWVRDAPAAARIDVIAAVSGDGSWVEGYVTGGSGRAVTVQTVTPDAAGNGWLGAIDELGPLGEGTFVFAAGEASALVPVRRLLRGALALPREQFAVSGYWRRGVVAFDHHSPIDPTDPD